MEVSHIAQNVKWEDPLVVVIRCRKVVLKSIRHESKSCLHSLHRIININNGVDDWLLLHKEGVVVVVVVVVVVSGGKMPFVHVGRSYGGRGGRGGSMTLGTGGVKKMILTGSKFMVNGEDYLEGWVGSGGGEVIGASVVLGVVKISLGENPGDAIGVVGGSCGFKDRWLGQRRTCFIHNAYWHALHADTYSALVVEMARAICFLENKDVRQQPMKVETPLVLLRSTYSLAWSELA
ncbi:hypothetical protein Tco_1351476 [Tanacetum coccineum]